MVKNGNQKHSKYVHSPYFEIKNLELITLTIKKRIKRTDTLERTEPVKGTETVKRKETVKGTGTVLGMGTVK